MNATKPKKEYLPRPEVVDKLKSLVKGRKDAMEAAELARTQPQKPYVAPERAGRNDPCPCGSGKKYKKCCLLKEEGS